MKYYKPKIKDFPDQALIILESQKKDPVFTTYVKSILKERYLHQSVTLEELNKKLHQTRSSLQQEIIWEALSIKMLKAKEEDTVRSCRLIDSMPIDHLVKVTQLSENNAIKAYAKKVCYKKQLVLEEELGMDDIDLDKWQQDLEELKEASPQNTNLSQESKLSNKTQYDLSISTRKFLKRFYDISYEAKAKLSHEDMEFILRSFGIVIPERGRIQNISYEDAATGKWLLVRNETTNRKGARIIPYKNPKKQLSEDIIAKEYKVKQKIN